MAPSPRSAPRLVSLLLGACATLGTVAATDAAVQPLRCPRLGWNSADYFISSSRHPLDERAQAWDERYQNNIDYQWQVWLNTRVTSVRFVFDKGAPPDPVTGDPGRPGFDLERVYGLRPSCRDWLTISGGNSVTLCGNLDQGHTVDYVSPPVAISFAKGPNDNYVNLRFHTNSRISRQGFTIKRVLYYCSRERWPGAGAATNVSRLHPNGQRDGTLVGPHDIRYLSTVQEADKPLILILRPDTPAAATDHADYDLYASPTLPTNKPGPGTAKWASFRGRVLVGGVWQMLDDVIVIEPVGYPRYIYYSVHWFPTGGTGGFRVYDNTASNKLTFRVGTDFDDRADPKNWDKLQWALRMAAAGLYNVTDGVAWLSGVQFWHASGNQTSDCGGAGCDIIYQQGPYASGGGLAVCTATACHPKGNFFALGARILFGDWLNAFDNPDGPLVESEVAAHELGHCLYGFPHAFFTGGNYACGHSLMIWAYSPEWRHLRDYCTGDLTSGNHGMDGTEPTTGLPTAGEWQEAAACDPAQFTVYTPAGSPPTPDPEGFERSDIWSMPEMFTIEEMN